LDDKYHIASLHSGAVQALAKAIRKYRLKREPERTEFSCSATAHELFVHLRRRLYELPLTMTDEQRITLLRAIGRLRAALSARAATLPATIDRADSNLPSET
jgi:hypothetical protein